MPPNPIPDRLQFWLKHDTWTQTQAALLLCGLDPQYSAVSDDGQLQGTQALMLDGSQLQWPDPPPIHPMITEVLLMLIKSDAEVRKGLEARWRTISQQLQDCVHWLQASPLTERASPQHYLAWAKRKGLGQYICATLGDSLSSVLGEVDEQPDHVADPPEREAPPATAPSSRAERPSPEVDLLQLAALFDPVKVAQLEAMFPSNDQWGKYAERAQRNGLVKARAGRRAFNPVLAAEWWLSTQGPGPRDWDRERCREVLGRNLPPRSEAQRGLFPKYD